MTREVLNEILAKHNLWLQSKDDGERAYLKYANLMVANLEDANLMDANLVCAKLNGADLEDADLECANLEGAKLMGAKLEGANLKDANLKDADIDYSAWPLWCGSLRAHVDDRIAVQLLYHTLSVVQHSPYVSEQIKRTLLTPDVVAVANWFHRVDECGKLKVYDNVEVSK